MATQRSTLFLAASILAGLLGVGPARADEGSPAVLRFHDHQVEPTDLVVKAGAPLQIHVLNANAEAIEFESFELNRERVVQPGQEIVVYLPPLDAGSYKFFDDFHRDTGEGTVTAR